MKIFIVFLAFLILCSACLSFQTDFNYMLQTQRQMKNLAEDCAAGAAMMLDQEELSEGVILFDTDSIEEYIGFMLSQRNLDIGFEHAESYSNKPAVTVKLVIREHPFFRNRELSKSHLSVTSTYAWE